MIGRWLSPAPARRPAAACSGSCSRYQAYLLVPMMFLEAASLHVASIGPLLGRPGPERARRETAGTGHGGRAACRSRQRLPCAVFLVLSPVRAVPFILVQQDCSGFISAAPLRRTTRECRCSPPRTRPTSCAGRCSRPATSGAAAHRLRSRGTELPDRASPVPVHAPAQPAAGPAARRGILRRAWTAYCQASLSARTPRPSAPQQGRQADPARVARPARPDPAQS